MPISMTAIDGTVRVMLPPVATQICRWVSGAGGREPSKRDTRLTSGTQPRVSHLYDARPPWLASKGLLIKKRMHRGPANNKSFRLLYLVIGPWSQDGALSILIHANNLIHINSCIDKWWFMLPNWNLAEPWRICLPKWIDSSKSY